MTEENKSKTKKSNKDNLDKRVVIYCGPTIPGKLQHFMVYNNGLPESAIEEIKKCPSINNLLIDPKDLVTVREKLNEKGSYENQMYESIQKYLGGR